jgi:UDP-N-acetylglucosamine transferase subunit ALG13
MKDSFIFVTVGSTDFDMLIQAIDRLAPSLQSEGIMQIGHGRYTPVNLPYFRFTPSLDPYFERATLVVAHAGLATTMEVLERRLPLVSVSNPDRYDNHQEDLVSTMDEQGYLVRCRRLDELQQAIDAAQNSPLRRYEACKCEIHRVINQYLTQRVRGGRLS